MTLQSALEKAWYSQAKWIWLLLPLTLLFMIIVKIRQLLFRGGVLKSYKASIPVIVVGNISVGGNGKTPLVLALLDYFCSQGLSVGVLSRGYQGSISKFPHLVGNSDNASEVGDEPMLIASRTDSPVVIDPQRSRGVKHLERLGCDLVVCDDGLQHYALQRDIEIVVMDKRRVGNGFMLPMGPLREPSSRLNRVSCLIKNGDFDYSNVSTPQMNMTLEPVSFVNVADSNKTMSCEDFVSQYTNVTMVCAIGNPDRFRSTLNNLKLPISGSKTFADHHKFVVTDLPKGTLVMTEKDAVKCQGFAKSDWWYLKVDANLPEQFYTLLKTQLDLQIYKNNETINGV